MRLYPQQPGLVDGYEVMIFRLVSETMTVVFGHGWFV